MKKNVRHEEAKIHWQSARNKVNALQDVSADTTWMKKTATVFHIFSDETDKLT